LQNGQLAIHLPAGRKLDMENADDLLSQYLGRRVRLVAQACGELEYLGYWPRIGELIHRSEYEVGKTLSGTFFDSAPIHLITSENIQSIARVIPSGKVGVERFRPNILLGAESDLDERKVLGVSLQVGEAHIKVIRRTRRCVVTTLPQHGLDTDLNILKTIYRLYGGYAGFYAEVLRPGVVRVGDAVKLL
ncbi:MAG: MOSC domain-containing protein, partial [Nitrososphaerota archaeon]